MTGLLGAYLLKESVRYLRKKNIEFLTVKTIGDTSSNRQYAKTIIWIFGIITALGTLGLL